MEHFVVATKLIPLRDGSHSKYFNKYSSISLLTQSKKDDVAFQNKVHPKIGIQKGLISETHI